MRDFVGDVTTTFVGNYYEVAGTQVNKYYYAGGPRLAMCAGGTFYYLLSDQLGSGGIDDSCRLRIRMPESRSAADGRQLIHVQ